jgi:hypothetical protein
MRLKPLKIGLFVSLFLFGIVACKQAPVSKTVNGVVMDASMNNVTIITDSGDTLNISTMDADPAKVHGVLIDDSVKVTYQVEKLDGMKILQATELVVTVHSPYYYIQGTWTEPNPIKPDEAQGFILNQDGTARSVGMATLLYENWNLDDNELTMNYKSIGNGQTLEGTDTLTIVKINADSLVLADKAGKVIWRLARQE